MSDAEPEEAAKHATFNDSDPVAAALPDEGQQVDIHKPKPVHSWREFFNELGVVFLGVLIALTFESLAEEWRWYSRVEETREQLRYEMGVNLALIDARLSRITCVSERADRLAAVVQTAVTTSRVPPLGDIGHGGFSATWPAGVWQSALSAQTAAHFPPRDLAALSRIYGVLGYLKEMSQRDVGAWESLRSMVGPGRPITPEIAERWIEALVLIRDDNMRIKQERETIQRILDRSSLGRAFPKIDPLSPPVSWLEIGCAPFGRAPATYAFARPTD